MNNLKHNKDERAFAICKSPNQSPEYFNGICSDGCGFILRTFEGDINVCIKQVNELPRSLDFDLEVYDGLSTSFSEYKASFESAMSLLESGELQKIILSKIIWVPGLIDPKDLFEKLQAEYPRAYNFLLKHLKLGCWIGSTPEVLVKAIEEGFKTMALAGTKSASDTSIWGRKEIEEHAIVRRYIEKRLDQHTLEYRTKDLEELNTGVVKHLLNQIHIKTRKDIFEISSKLHPTPAICGLPQGTAFEAINKIENHRRSIYCGYLGTVNGNEDDELYIALRCARIYQNGILLYVGGGITLDSVLQDEWDETEKKARTIKDLL